MTWTTRLYRFFLSSTFEDLESERRQIIQYLWESGQGAIAMEKFPSSDRTLPHAVKEEIDKSDAFILLIGVRDGSLTKDKVPWVIAELRHAIDTGKRIYAFRPRKLSPAASELMMQAAPLIDQRCIKSYDDIVGEFRANLPYILRELEDVVGVGWVSAQRALDELGLGAGKEVLDSPTLKGHLIEISKAHKFFGRLSRNAEYRQYAAHAVWRALAVQLFDTVDRRTLYFEGGATNVQSIRALLRYLRGIGRESHPDGGKPQLTLLTNGYLNYSFLMPELAHSPRHPFTDFRVLPNWGAYPDYGIFIGDIRTKNHPLSQVFWTKKGENHEAGTSEFGTTKAIASALKGTNAVFVTSVSGFALPEAVAQECTGPWVRSYPIYVFKKIFFDLEIPQICLLDDHKWARPMERDISIRVGPVPNKESYEQHPLCFAMATSDIARHDQFGQYFKQLGFMSEVIQDNERTFREGLSGKAFACVCYNRAFEKAIITDETKKQRERRRSS